MAVLVQNIWAIHKFTWLPVLGFLRSNVFQLIYWGMSQNRGAYMGAPNLFFLAKKEILGHPSFETFPHEKNMWSYFVCMFLFVVHRFLQYTMWDFMWNFKPLFFLKQHTYPVHGLADIVCEIECIYVYFFTRLFWFFLICFRRSLVDSLWIAY